MTTQEAKLILQSYRPGGEDAADPFFAMALEMAQSNRELQEWFSEQRNFDASMIRALRSEVPPAWLRETILAKPHAPSTPERNGFNPLFHPRLLVTLTAAIVLLAGISVFQMGSVGHAPTMTVAGFAREALDIKEQGRIALSKMSTDPEQLRAWLAERGAPDSFVIPPGLRGIPSLGCQSYTIGGTKVALVCFNLGNNQVAHLFVVDKSALSDGSGDSLPRLREENGLAFATWSSGDKSYVLTGDNVSIETLRKLV